MCSYADRGSSVDPRMVTKVMKTIRSLHWTVSVFLRSWEVHTLYVLPGYGIWVCVMLVATRLSVCALYPCESSADFMAADIFNRWCSQGVRKSSTDVSAADAFVVMLVATRVFVWVLYPWLCYADVGAADVFFSFWGRVRVECIVCRHSGCKLFPVYPDVLFVTFHWFIALKAAVRFHQ